MKPFYRLVVADARMKRDGKFIEKVGTYDPIPKKDNTKEITVNSERIRYWLTCGAVPSERVAWLFGKIGLLPSLPPRQSVATAIPKYLNAKKKK